MFWDVSAIKGYSIRGSNGSLGSVSDLLFDDTTWMARWLVVDTGHWLSRRKVLLPVSALRKANPERRELVVDLTTKQVENSPDIETHKPVARQVEVNIYEVYGLEPYWGGGLYPISNAMAVPFAAPLAPDERAAEARGIADAERSKDDPHLRSIDAVSGYRIHASDGEIGHVEDFVLEDDDWTIRYLEVDTRNWWPGRHVLIQPKLVAEINWGERHIRLNATRQKVKDSPPYDPTITVDGAYADKIHTYYDGF